jgi:hypothetical protein
MADAVAGDSYKSPSLATGQSDTEVDVSAKEMKLRHLTRPQKKEYVDHNLTFSPKLNEVSLKLARRRSENLDSYQDRQQAFLEANRCRFDKEHTFKPVVSERSLLIVEKLGSTFHLRQQKHLEKKQKLQEDAYKHSPSFKPTINRTRGLPTKSISICPANQQIRHRYCEFPSRAKSMMGSCSMNGNLPECPSVTNITGKGLKVQTHQRPLSGSPSVQPLNLVCQVKERGRHVRMHTSPGLCGEDGGRSMIGEHRKQCSLTVGVPVKSKTMSVSCADHTKLKRIKAKADDILKSKKVFVVRGPYKAIRRGMRHRGWVEKDYSKGIVNENAGQTSPEGEGSFDNSGDYPNESSEEDFSDEDEYCLLSRAVRNSIPYFIWTVKREQDLYTCLRKDQFANHIKGSGAFTTKVGLCTNLQEALWLGDVDSRTFFPRCYRLSCDLDKECFIDDYRLTAAMCVLKIATNDSYKMLPAVSEGGIVVPKSVLSLAVRACQVHLNTLEHGDIEGSSTWLARPLGEPEWSILLMHYYNLVKCGGSIEGDDNILSLSSDVLDELEQHCPQLSVDGVYNVWIVKPGALSRGRGINCMNQLNDILELVSSPTYKKDSRWIVQKYIGELTV